MCHYAECQDLLIIMLNVIKLSVVMLNVVAPFLHRISLKLFLWKKSTSLSLIRVTRLGNFPPIWLLFVIEKMK
jgi:hypothetical protein